MTVPTSSPVLDINGREIKTGMRVVAAVTIGRSSGLRIGTVTAVKKGRSKWEDRIAVLMDDPAHGSWSSKACKPHRTIQVGEKVLILKDSTEV